MGVSIPRPNGGDSRLPRAVAAEDFGRPSIAPEKLLRAMLLQAFYGIRFERQFFLNVSPCD